MRFSRETFSTYPTRILTSVVFSLLLVIGLFHLPLDLSSPRIGWAVRGETPWIDLQDVRETETDAEASAQKETAPVPTRHVRDVPSPAAVGEGDDPSGDAAPVADEPEPPRNRPSLTSIAKLAPENQPAIVGGMGALRFRVEREKGL